MEGQRRCCIRMQWLAMALAWLAMATALCVLWAFLWEYGNKGIAAGFSYIIFILAAACVGMTAACIVCACCYYEKPVCQCGVEGDEEEEKLIK